METYLKLWLAHNHKDQIYAAWGLTTHAWEQLSEILPPGSLSKLFGVITAALCILREKIEARQCNKVGMTFRRQCGILPDLSGTSGTSATGKSEEAGREILEKGLSTVARTTNWTSTDGFG